MSTETISIERVDTAELERHRLALGTISQLSLQQEQADALEGVLNMLDHWSDERLSGAPTTRDLDQAEQQITGYNSAYSGYACSDMCEGMALTKGEWEALKRRGVLHWLNPDLRELITEHMATKS